MLLKPPLINFFLLGNIIFTGSCSNTHNEQKEQPTDTLSAVAGTIPVRADALQLREAKPLPEYLDAILELNSPVNSAKLKGGLVRFDYEIKNFSLVKPDSGYNKSRYIQLILNADQYLQTTVPFIKTRLPAGSYTSLSFLCRANNESIKSPESYVLRKFSVGDAPQADIDLSQPHIFYHFPRGEFVGDAANHVLLDFYLVNTALSPKGNKVRVRIDSSEFLITKWAAYTIDNLKSGKHSIRLELLDKGDRPIVSPYNPVVRTFSTHTSLH